MATKKIQIEFDLDSNDVKIASEATLTLAQQIKVLKQELQKTEEGTKQFEILKNKLNETKDNFERVNVKSRELFGTLSLIPGPIGEIAGKLNGAISLFKVFSGFSLKDVSGQLKALSKDFTDILEKLGSWANITEKTDQNLTDLTQSTNNLDNSIGGLNTATGALLANQQKETEELKKVNEQIVRNSNAHGVEVKELTAADLARQKYIETQMAGKNVTNTTIEQLGELEQKHGAEYDALQNSTTAVKEQTKQVGLGTKAWRLFAGALTAVGIGLVVSLITDMITKLVDLVTGTKAAEKATREFSDALQEQNYWLDYNAKEAKRAGDIKIAQLKAEGASAKQIRDEELNQSIIFFRESLRQREEAYKKYSQADKTGNTELIDIAREDYRKKNDLALEAEANVKKTRLKNQEEERKELEDANKKKEDLAKEAAEKAKQKQAERIAAEKARLDAQIQLEIDSENTRQDVLEKLLEQRFKLEEGSAAELELLYKEHQKKVREALDDDYEKRRQKQIDFAQAAIDIEESQAEVNTEKLIELLSNRRDIELQELTLTEEQKKAIIAKYEADFRRLRQDAREKQLVQDINANRGNFDIQIELYRQFAQEVVNSENYTAGEKLRIQKETNDKIQALELERFDNEVNQLQLEFGQTYAYNQEYYDELNKLYDAEEDRYKKLFEEKKITEAEYTEFLKKNRDARNDISKAELNAKMADLEALAVALEAGAALAGEQTRLGKGLAVASATINTYTAANQVLADPTLPTVLKIISAAGIILKGLSNVKRIVSVPIPGTGNKTGAAQFSGGVINVNQRRAQGGYITGAGGEQSDDIPAFLSNGEYVVNARSTRAFRPLLETINSAATLPAFAAGGMVTGMNANIPFKSQNETIADAITTAFGQTPIKTYVTATEVSTQQQFDRIIKSRSII